MGGQACLAVTTSRKTNHPPRGPPAHAGPGLFPQDPTGCSPPAPAAPRPGPPPPPAGGCRCTRSRRPLPGPINQCLRRRAPHHPQTGRHGLLPGRCAGRCSLERR